MHGEQKDKTLANIEGNSLENSERSTKGKKIIEEKQKYIHIVFTITSYLQFLAILSYLRIMKKLCRSCA